MTPAFVGSNPTSVASFAKQKKGVSIIKFKGHLHLHTEYSALDGLTKIEDAIIKAKALGQTFIAITDHGSSSGLYEASLLSEKHDFKVLMGEEFYYENPESMRNGHLILIAKNETGLKNLFKLQHLALENFYYKPRINLEMLKEHNEGLICSTACLANQISQFILMGENHLALNHIFELKNIFKDDLYIELQSSTNADVIKVNNKLEEICEEFNLKPVLTNDVHYLNKEDYETHDILLCIQQVKKHNDPKRMRFTNNDFWLKSQEEMEEYVTYLKRETLEKCYENLSEIDEKCQKELKITSGNFLPKFCETKEQEDDELENLTWQRFMKKPDIKNEEFKKDLFKELNVINKTGYSGYFLIVHEYINWAKENGIMVGDGRGSGAGCKVAYTIGITEVNPQKYNLLFERFLTPGREPDFDVDFSDIGAVFKHLQDRYGKDNVARVGAFSRLTAKSAMRKVMSVFNYSQIQIKQIIDLMPDRLEFTLQEAMNESKELSSWLEDNPTILKHVTMLEGKLDHMSTHAGGVIICEGLTEMLPLSLDSKDKDKLVVALDKKALEKLGHYKFDVLGLKSLTLMESMMNYVNIDWSQVDFEDKNVYDMLSRGDVLGVFQLSEQKDKVMQQQPKSFEDLIAINALIRPGVCDWNTYLKAREANVHSDLDFMNCTHGLIVYQDQYLQLAEKYAGWDIAFSDKHIRKNKNILNDEELKEKWYKDTGNTEESRKLWDEICEIVSQGYGFNRAHSTSYARLSFQTAYMKYYYPKIFYAAYMTQNLGDNEKLLALINEVKQIGIKVIPPKINSEARVFTPTEEGIVMPLTAIKGIGDSVIEEIERLKPITSIEDFLANRIKRKLKSNNFANLIYAGAFDEFGERGDLIKEYLGDEKVEKYYKYEKEMFGFYLSSSPFEEYEGIRKFSDYDDGDTVIVVLNMEEVSVRTDKRGNEMAFAVGANDKELIRIIVFSSVWSKTKLQENKIYMLKGKKDKGNILLSYAEEINK